MTPRRRSGMRTIDKLLSNATLRNVVAA